MELKGTFTALVTPFNQDESIDEKALRDLVDFQIAGGVSGLVPMGTTGESPTLSHGEHIRVIEIVIDAADGRVPILAGTGSNCTSEAIDITKQAMECGADGSLQVAPYYNKPSQEGFYRHFIEIANSVDIPLVIYNIPGRTGKNIEVETILRLAEHENIIGIKEASGDINQIGDIIGGKPEDFAVVSGDDNMAFPLMALGGAGVISVASNVMPKEISKMINTGIQGNLDEARQLHYKLLPLFKAMFYDTNPIPVKYALHAMGKIEETYRLPMCSMSQTKKEALLEVLKDLNLV